MSANAIQPKSHPKNIKTAEDGKLWQGFSYAPRAQPERFIEANGSFERHLPCTVLLGRRGRRLGRDVGRRAGELREVQ